MNLLRARQLVSADRESVFGFFSRPENLAELTPGWLRFQTLTPSPIPMREGAVIDYQIGLGPVPTRWRTLITAYDPPHLFIDEQMLGPYSFWHHTHRFEAHGRGTQLIDEVRYLLPFGVLGEAAHALAIKGCLAMIFNHRRRLIADRFTEVDDSQSGVEFTRV